MKRINKWRYSLFALLLIAALVLTSCGENGNDNGVPPEPEPTFTIGIVEEADPTPTPDAETVEATPTLEDDVEATPAPGVPETGMQPGVGVPPEIEQFADEWPMGNKDYRNTRASMTSAINASNVDQLDMAWVFQIPGIGAYGAAASTPIIANGVVYLHDLMSNVFALDLETGDLVWEYRLEQSALGPNGVAIGYGKVFAQGGINELHAIDMETGELIWITNMEGPSGSHQPYVYNGKVFTAAVAGAVQLGQPGVASARQGYAAGNSGIAYAFDEATGELIWRFQVVEDDFWGRPDINGGGGIWYPPAIHPESGLSFWATGNPAPFPGIVGFPNAASRPGPNLYTNSMLALDMETGELEWYNQVLPQDLFDLDFQISPILTTLEEDGLEIVIGSGKLGRVYSFDLQTGEILWETEVGIHMNDDLDEVPIGEEVFVMPGVWGGVETPMAYADGVVYMQVLNLGTPYTADGFGATDGSEAVANATGRTQLPTATFELVAIDASNGEILWQVEYDAPGFGAATVVNDLVFTSSFTGRITAHDRDDGSEVWAFQAPGGINGWPAVAGDTIVFPVGTAQVPVLMALRLGAEGAEIPLPGPTLPPSP
jgi:outer membrane protein assembly factor BamB